MPTDTTSRMLVQEKNVECRRWLGVAFFQIICLFFPFEVRVVFCFLFLTLLKDLEGVLRLM